MDYLFVLFLALAVFSTGFCATIQKNYSETVTVPEKNSRGITIRDFMVCGLTRDISCFLDTADIMVKQQMDGVLAQADAEIVKATGRADKQNSPSHLPKIINRLISEITDMFQNGFSGFFKSAREGEDDEEEKESENKKVATVGEGRKKKKKEKIVALIKLVILGLLIKAKVTLLLKALAAALQVKYFLLALGAFLLNVAKFYFDVKKGKHPQKVIYYEHAQHQHHYETDDDWASSGPGEGGSYWGRAYDEEESPAQNLAYAKQKPHRQTNDQSSFSWFG